MTRELTLRSIDIPSIHRFGIGFEPLFDGLLNAAAQQETNYPPYNIVKLADDQYMISIAVAGFSEENIEITKENDTLLIEGTATQSADDVTYIHKGIGARKFRREFRLAEHVEVNLVNLDLGILNIYLQRVVPEDKKPKKIAITSTK